MATTIRQQAAVVSPPKAKGVRTPKPRSRVAPLDTEASPQAIPSWDTKALAELDRHIKPFTRPAFIKAWLAVPNPSFGDQAPSDFVSSTSKPDAPPAKVRIAQLAEIRRELAYIIVPEHIDLWLATKNPYFKGAKPIALVRDGKGQRVLDLIYRVHDGVPLD